jgi:hypothetical protein
MTRNRNFYALENPYGLRSLNTSGAQANSVHRFDTKRLRDAWVDERPTHRKAVPASAWTVREAKAAAKHGLAWSIHVRGG